MRTTELLVKSFTNDLAIADNHATNHGIGLDKPDAVGGELKSALHECFVSHESTG